MQYASVIVKIWCLYHDCFRFLHANQLSLPPWLSKLSLSLPLCFPFLNQLQGHWWFDSGDIIYLTITRIVFVRSSLIRSPAEQFQSFLELVGDILVELRGEGCRDQRKQRHRMI